MKYNCELVKDLIPLYQDKVCSDESRRIVEEHVKECEKCRKTAEMMELDFEYEEDGNELDKNSVKKCFGRIKKRFAIILAAVIVALPVCTVTVRLGINEYKKEGICFSNLDEYKTVSDFMKNIKNENFEKAFGRLNREGDYESIISAKDIDENASDTSKEDIERKKFVYENYSDVLDMSLEEYEKNECDKATALFEEAKDRGYYIVSYKKIDSYYAKGIGWIFTYRVKYHTELGTTEDRMWDIVAKDGKISLQFYSVQGESEFLEEAIACA